MQIIWIVGVLLGSSAGSTQPIGTWRNHTSPLVVQSVASAADGRWWANTTGGLVHGQIDGSRITYHKSDGLYGLNASAIAFDTARNRIWIGFEDGTFQSLDASTSTFRRYTDIQRSDRFLTKRINRITVAGTDLLIGTDFGVVVVNAQNGLVRDAYATLGTFNTTSRVSDVVKYGDLVVAATLQGLAIGDMRQADLLVPTNWRNHAISGIRSLGVTGTELYIGTVDGNLRWNDGNPVAAGHWPQPVERFEPQPDGSLLGVTATSVIRLTPTGSAETVGLPVSGGAIASVAKTPNGYVFGFRNRGLVVRSGNADDVVEWNGPYLNQISQMHYQEGVLALASSGAPNQFSIGLNATGYSIRRGEEWLNVNVDTDSFMSERNLHSVYRVNGNRDHLFFGTFGNGVIRHSLTDGSQVHYNRSNSNLPGFEVAPDFIITSGLAADRSGDVWASILANLSEPLVRYDRETEQWIRYPVSPNAGASSQYFGLYIDSFDQKWVPLYTANLIPRGVLVATHRSDGTERSFRLTSAENEGALPNDNVRAVVQDQRGEVWVGTDRGIARFLFPDRIIDGTSQERRGTPLINEDVTVPDRLLLRDIRVTSIAVDPSNRKWIGTLGDGLWLVNENGGAVLAHFTAENSPLLSNTIQSMAIDPRTGEVHIATDAGLVSYQSDSQMGRTRMADLVVYPNPFRYSDSVSMVVEGLKDRSTVSVVSVDGQLVARFSTRGGRAVWNGLDLSNRRVPTGVYMVIATHESGGRATATVLMQP